MAHRPEQHDDPEALDTVATDVLRRALALPPAPAREHTQRLRALLAPLCTAALRRGHQAEELVIRLKTLWQTVGVTDDNPYGRRDAIFERVVSLCIEEYYRALDGPPV